MNVPDNILEPFAYNNPNTMVRREFLLNLFQNHIGANNAIPKSVLVDKVFGNTKNKSVMQKYFLYSILRKDMTYLRKKTNCFIVFDIIGTQAVYYIPKTMNDAKRYMETLGRVVKGSQYMQKRCEQAVKEKWYKRF